MVKYLTLLLSLLLLLSCERDRKESEAVMFLHYFTGSLSQGIHELSDSLNEGSGDFRIVATPMEHEEFKINIRLQLDTENPPDIFTYWAGARTSYLAEREKIVPIGALIDSFSVKASFKESVLEACSYGGELYMLPLTQHYVGFFYSKKVFGDLGLGEPSTWEELLDGAEKIRRSGVNPFVLGSRNRWPTQFWFDYLLLRTSGFLYREELMAGKIQFTDEPVLRVFEIWKGLLDKGYFNQGHSDLTWAQAADQLTTGESAMTLMGTWIIPYLEDSDIGFFPFPIMDPKVETAALGPIDGALVAANSTKQKASGEVLMALSKADAQMVFNRKSGALIPLLGVSREFYSELQLEILKEMEESSHWAFNYDLATAPLRAEAGLDFFAALLRDPPQYRELAGDLQGRISHY